MDMRPCLMRMGSERANIWCMAAVSPGASLSLSGSTLVWNFLLWPGRLGGMCSVIFAERAGPPWGLGRDARNIAPWMESCLEAASTIRGDGLSGNVPQSNSKIYLQRWAMRSSQPDGLATFLMKMLHWAMPVEAIVALRYLRTWTIFCGRGNRTKGLAQMSSLSSMK